MNAKAAAASTVFFPEVKADFDGGWLRFYYAKASYNT
jgi:hypothetical protein